MFIPIHLKCSFNKKSRTTFFVLLCNLASILFVQNQQWDHQKNVTNLFHVNKDTRTTSNTSFWCLNC